LSGISVDFWRVSGEGMDRVAVKLVLAEVEYVNPSAEDRR
jgi:hypothetical protein